MNKIDKSNIKCRFGKYKNELVSEVIKKDAKYLKWYASTTKLENDKKIINQILNDGGYMGDTDKPTNEGV